MESESLVDTLRINCVHFNQRVVDLTIYFFPIYSSHIVYILCLNFNFFIMDSMSHTWTVNVACRFLSWPNDLELI